MLTKNIPDTPNIDHMTLVLVLLGSSNIMTMRITEKRNTLTKPTHPQLITNEIGPLSVCNIVITFEYDDECPVAIPITLSILAINEVK